MAIMTIPHHLNVKMDGTVANCGSDNGQSGASAQDNMQFLFAEHAKLTEDRGVTIVDISEVPKSELTDFEFYISSKEPLESFIGCTFEDYEQKDGFWTYKIKPITNVMRLDNV